MTRRFRLSPLVLLLALAFAACAARLPTSGVEPDETGRYPAVAVAPLLSDDVRVEYVSGFDFESGPRVATNWDTRAKAGRIVGELLRPSRTTVTTVDLIGLPSGGGSTQDWSHQIWGSLQTAGRLGDATVLLVLRQNAIDARGHQYSPALDFLAFGLVGLAVGAATKDERFQPSFELLTTAGFDAAMGEPSRCTIGIDTALLDAQNGATLGQVTAVLGAERLPAGFRARNWASMNDDDRRVAETYCIAALRRAVSQAVNALGLTSR